jgi:predicted GIY-YIG superfamily endonuclease
MTIGIYKITNTINGKYYIGSSTRIEHRIQEHKCYLGQNKHHVHHS